MSGFSGSRIGREDAGARFIHLETRGMAADRVDRLMIYRAPIVIGNGLAGIGDIGLHDLARAHDRWHHVATQDLGSDTLSIYDRLR